jgi:hypothetical protein
VIFVCYFLKNNAVVSKYQKISNYLLLFNWNFRGFEYHQDSQVKFWKR